jgi:hypothetical protein
MQVLLCESDLWQVVGKKLNDGFQFILPIYTLGTVGAPTAAANDRRW